MLEKEKMLVMKIWNCFAEGLQSQKRFHCHPKVVKRQATKKWKNVRSHSGGEEKKIERKKTMSMPGGKRDINVPAIFLGTREKHTAHDGGGGSS